MDNLTSRDPNGPWLDVVLEDLPSQKWLLQGDLLVDVKFPVFEALLDLESEHLEIPVDEGTLIVMTQSCDLANQKAPVVACCPVHTLDEFEFANSHFKQRDWEHVRQGKIVGLHLLPGSDLKNNRTCLVVDFRVIHSLTFNYVLEFIKDGQRHSRLRSPYLEHMSQAFARLFMRVGLSVDIPPFK